MAFHDAFTAPAEPTFPPLTYTPTDGKKWEEQTDYGKYTILDRNYERWQKEWEDYRKEHGLSKHLHFDQLWQVPFDRAKYLSSYIYSITDAAQTEIRAMCQTDYKSTKEQEEMALHSTWVLERAVRMIKQCSDLDALAMLDDRLDVLQEELGLDPPAEE